MSGGALVGPVVAVVEPDDLEGDDRVRDDVAELADQPVVVMRAARERRLTLLERLRREVPELADVLGGREHALEGDPTPRERFGPPINVVADDLDVDVGDRAVVERTARPWPEYREAKTVRRAEGR